MRKVMRLVLFFAVCLTIVGTTATPAQAQCTKIKDGTLFATNGAQLANGYDAWGYNYQSRMFNGLHENVSRPVVPRIEGDTRLVMKWSQDWLSNMDCDGDGKLDRGYDPKTGASSGISQGWTTNHMEGSYLGSDGAMHHWTYFVKIAWVGKPPVGLPDPWAGARIWGQYGILQEMQNDPFGEYDGTFRTKIKAPGLGRY